MDSVLSVVLELEYISVPLRCHTYYRVTCLCNQQHISQGPQIGSDRFKNGNIAGQIVNLILKVCDVSRVVTGT